MQLTKLVSAIKNWLYLILVPLTFSSYGKQQQLNVAIPEHGYAPFIIIDKNEFTGILLKPLQLAAHNIGIELTYRYAPEKRSQLMLDAHDVDTRMESTAWVETPEDYWWSEPITMLDDVLIYHKSSTTDFETDQALTGAELITHLGYFYPTLQPLIEANIIQRSDFSSEFAMLQSLARPTPGVKRVAVMNKDVALWIIKAHAKFQDTFLFSERVIDTAPLQFQFAKRPELRTVIDQLNAELTKFKHKHIVEKISERILSNN